jgi:ATP-binding cassette, subfamily A (ABC1), member 3
LVQLTAGNNLGFNLAMNTGFVMALVVALFVMFYIKERITKNKLLQVISGVNKFIFWMVAFVLDYFVFILIVIVYVSVIGAYQQEGFSTFEELLRITSILLLFGFAALPLTYVLSFAFRVPATGLVSLAIGYIVSGTIFYIVYFSLINEAFELEWIAVPLGWTFLVFPHYSMTRALSNLNIMQTTYATCDSQCDLVPNCNMTAACKLELPCAMENITTEVSFLCSLQESCCNRNYFSFEQTGTGIMMVAMALVGVVSFIILFVLEFRLIQTMINRCRKTSV